VPVLSCYEAGYEGFWLYRLLAAAGHRVLVIDPASLLVNRRAKRAKTDRIDAKAMIRALMAFNRGEDQVLSAVRIPSVEQDDQRRLIRERQRLVKERTAHSNRIKGLLMTQGIVGFDPRNREAEQRLDHLVTGDGRPLGSRLKAELRRELVRLRLVIDQIVAIAAERDAMVRVKQVGPPTVDDVPADALGQRSDEQGPKDQGITKSGPPSFRAQMIQITWRWLRYQPHSRLSHWFTERTTGASGRVRRIMIVALARKLLVALWR
jgi:transposase